MKLLFDYVRARGPLSNEGENESIQDDGFVRFLALRRYERLNIEEDFVVFPPSFSG
jgi:hypothetical protein